jgi:hypothetical protein
MSKIIFRRFNSIIEAELAKNILTANGIQSEITQSGIQYGGDMGDGFGADLVINQDDLGQVKDLLE